MPLSSTLDALGSEPDPTGEEAAKNQVIVRVLQEIGWDVFSPKEVRYEHPVGGKGGGRVDIALMSEEGGAAALIEAKAPGQRLADHVEQLVGYAFHEGVDICVLSSGKVWWLYLPMERGVPFEKRRFAVLDIRKDPVDQLAEDLVAFLGKDNLLNGHARQQARRVLRAAEDQRLLNREMPRIWRRMAAEPDPGLVELVSKRVYDQVGLRPTDAQIAATLGGRPVESPPLVLSPGPTPRKLPTGGLIHISSSAEAPGVSARAFELWGDRHEVGNWKALLVKVAELLYERHGSDFERILELSGQHNTVPMATRDPSQLRARRQVADSGIYLAVQMTALSFYMRAHTFIEHFGHPPEALQIWGEQVMTPSKPTGFEIWGEHRQVRSWSGLLLGVVEALHSRHGPDFEGRLLELQGRSKLWSSRNRSDIGSGTVKQVAESGVFIHTGLSGPNAEKRARRYLKHFGYPETDLQIFSDPIRRPISS